MKKGDRLGNLVIETLAAEGKCIAKVDAMVIFLQGGAPGDTVEAEVTKIKSSYLEGRVTAVQKLSPHRAEPFCEHFGICGGCSWQHINYDTQLFYKQKQVVDNLERIGGITLPEITRILGSGQTRYYRNRLDFTFTANRWLTKEEMHTSLEPSEPLDESLSSLPAQQLPRIGEPGLGFHIPRMYDKVFDVKNCHLQPEPSNSIRLAVRETAIENGIEFFDLRRQIGYLRSVTIRTTTTEEVMVILQVAYDRSEWLEKILNMLSERFPAITSLNYVINGKRNDTFSDLNIVCWKGIPYITEQMPTPDQRKMLQFRIGPKSFYQTNPEQAYQLYKIASEMAAIQPHELVYDLYTGTGTIANFVASQAKRVVGLEYVAAAIDDAKINSQINGITNAEFFAGDIKDLLDESFLNEHGRPDVVITDPPRVGMHEDVTRMLLKAAPQRIVYVSCNAATQARDLKTLDKDYKIVAIRPVDMFPQTMHVENVVSLVRRN